MAPAFLDAMVCCAAAPAEVALWEGVLRDSFAALKGFSFLDADKAEGPMKRWGQEAWARGRGLHTRSIWDGRMPGRWWVVQDQGVSLLQGGLVDPELSTQLLPAAAAGCLVQGRAVILLASSAGWLHAVSLSWSV